jgi:hypothetical protein
MDPVTGEQFQIHVGDEVHDAEDNKVGTVAAFDSRVLTVEHGLLRKGTYYIPANFVNACNGGTVFLNLTKEQIESQGYDQPPAIPTEADGVPLTK